MITNIHNAISKILGQLKNNNGEKIWGTPKNTEVDARLVQRREEPEKEISENKFQLVNICK